MINMTSNSRITQHLSAGSERSRDVIFAEGQIVLLMENDSGFPQRLSQRIFPATMKHISYTNPNTTTRALEEYRSPPTHLAMLNKRKIMHVSVNVFHVFREIMNGFGSASSLAHATPCHLLTNRQTDRQTDKQTNKQSENIVSLAEVKIHLNVSLLQMLLS